VAPERHLDPGHARPASPIYPGLGDGHRHERIELEIIESLAIDRWCNLGAALKSNVGGTIAEEAKVETDPDQALVSVAGQRTLGKVPVFLNMNQDLITGEELVITGSGNQFSVAGEPHIEIAVESDEAVATIEGIDVYDPATGEARSRDTDHVALWIIDPDDEGEGSVFRHAYFLGGQDPCTKLKANLKAEIDEDPWASRYHTTSRALPKPVPAVSP
jgi:adenine-specific DNA-methyltransferase